MSSTAKSTAPPSSKQADRLEEEWKQCLGTIEKFEDRLDVLRRYGFSLVTGLLSTDAVIWKFASAAISTPVTLGAIVSTGLLIVALWILDRDYRLYQRSASQRARVIEGELGYGLQRSIEHTYRSQRMWRYIQSLYWVFALAAVFIGIIVLVGEQFWQYWIIDPLILLAGLLYIWLIEPRIWYFAYGLSMYAERIADRIGRTISGEHATLIGYDLEFNKRSYSDRNVGFANIIPHPNSKVQGVLYRIHESELWKLDGYEGYPTHYGREEIDVMRDNGRMVEAQVYIATNPVWLVETSEALKPDKDYLTLKELVKPKLSSNYKATWNEYLERFQAKAEGRGRNSSEGFPTDPGPQAGP